MKILEQNDDFVVIVKDVGIDSEKEVPEKLTHLIGGEVYTLHRLDKYVGGVMVYARNKKAAAMLSKAIQDGLMVKRYVTIVHGTPDEKGVFEDILFKDSAKNKVYVVKRERKGTKKAKLEYERVSSGELSLVKVRLHTGRTHQIRVQFASRGFPLLGDKKYGAKDVFDHPFLFSSEISFPFKNENYSFKYLPNWYKDNTN
jgi:23S rRNA pseudouridine1911/1915/1917 synthase